MTTIFIHVYGYMRNNHSRYSHQVLCELREEKKENLYCHNSITLGEKKNVMHIIYLFLYDNIEKDT